MANYGVISGPYLDTFHAVIVYLNSNNKRHFLTHMLIRVSTFTSYDGATINNDDRKEF